MTEQTMTPDEVLRIISRMGREAKAWREEAKKAGAVFSVSDDQDRQAEAVVAALIVERDGYKAGWWDVVEMLGGKKLDISNAQYHASVLAPKIRELIARNAELEAELIGRSLGEVHALIAENSALTDERDDLRAGGLIAQEMLENAGIHCFALSDALARAEAGSHG